MAVVSQRFDALGFDDPEKTYHLGIMGGTFDPIHIGHLACAEQVRETFSLDAVIFIPAGNPVFKKDRKVTPAQDRLAMCACAVKENPYFDVSDIETLRAGLTYTVDTLQQIRAHYPANVHLHFITGADAVLSIISWKDSAAIAHLAKLIAVTRPGYAMPPELIERLDASDFDVAYAEVTALAISSSNLREKVAAGKSIRYLTKKNVYDYIEAHGLYREGNDA